MEDIHLDMSIEGYNYCPIHNHEIDYELVNEIKPLCIKMRNGCGNCPCCVYISKIKVKDKDGKEICKETRTPR